MLSLACKYRPDSFENVCSQDSIITILNQQLNTDTIKNTYLFCGASGCGKTTVARIFAHKVNSYIDNAGHLCSSEPIEIDGASNNGVDNVKSIINGANERSLDGKYKVFIIDECHALTTQAWQAFLKCIEEPPAFTIFIFCTTDPQKVPDTIKNRCMRFNFNRIKSELISQRLQYICNCEHISNYVDACTYISKICKNQMRDAIALLEKAISYNKNDLSINNVLYALGQYSYDLYFDLIDSLVEGNSQKALQIIDYIYNEGYDIKQFIDNFLQFSIDITKYCIINDINNISIPSSYQDRINYTIGFDDAGKYYCNFVNYILDIKNNIKNDINPKTTVDAMIIKLMR